MKAGLAISHGRAAEILGIRKHELIDIYDKPGFSWLDLTVDDSDAKPESKQNVKFEKRRQCRYNWRCEHEQQTDYEKR